MPPNEPKPRVAVIAGATGNVGGAAATALARRGFRVVLLGRNLEKLNDRARSWETKLRKEDPSIDGAILSVAVDLTDLTSLSEASREIRARFASIDVLILSAVTLTQDGPTILADGNEFMFSTNVLGQFRLASLLRPAIEAAHGIIAHVVAPFHRDIDWDDLQSMRNHNSMEAYERSKTCHRILAQEMARRFGDTLTSFAFDPGFAIDRKDPELKKRWPVGWIGLLWSAYALVAAKPPAIAGNALAELVSGSLNHDDLHGAYYRLEVRSKKPGPSMDDPAVGSRLWNALEELAFPEIEESVRS